MTPSERIAARLARVHLLAAASWPYAAEVALDALCPMGERVVLDRSGPEDRLVLDEACAELERMRTIVSDLAAADPTLYDLCALCDGEDPTGERQDIGWHEPDCPWRRAYVATTPQTPENP